jgi:glutamyl-tRNA synthetase
MTPNVDDNHNSPMVDVQERSTDAPFNIAMDQPGKLFQLPSSEKQVFPGDIQESVDQFLRFLVLFPDYINQAFGEYRKPVILVGGLLLAGLTIAVADGVLDRLNTIPLFAPTFELIGLGFSGWFVLRYLLYADTRQELLVDLDEVRGRIIGTVQSLEAAHEEESEY